MIMDVNPYESPRDSNFSQANQPTSGARQQPWLATTGFVLSLVGVAGVIIVGWPNEISIMTGRYLALCCLPGCILSLVSLAVQTSNLTKWGIILGLFGSAY